MRHASGHPAARASTDSYLMGFAFAIFCALVLVRFIVNANVLDTVIKYSAEGGSIIEKIHPSSYGFVVVLSIMLSSFRIELSEWDLRALRSFVFFTVVIGFLSALMWSSGRSGSAGYLVDSYVVSCIAGALMLMFPPAWRETVGAMLIVFIAVSACIALGEFALHKRLLPYWATEISFRPTGLTEHPLM